jgi:hypothetical protein
VASNSVEALLEHALEHVSIARTLVEDAGAILVGAGDLYAAGSAATICSFVDSIGMITSEIPSIMSVPLDVLQEAARVYIAKRQQEELEGGNQHFHV